MAWEDPTSLSGEHPVLLAPLPSLLAGGVLPSVLLGGQSAEASASNGGKISLGKVLPDAPGLRWQPKGAQRLIMLLRFWGDSWWLYAVGDVSVLRRRQASLAVHAEVVVLFLFRCMDS